MAGYENIRDANSKRTPEELREIQSAEEKEAVKSRRRKANFQKTLNLLLTAEIDNEEWKPILESLGVECTLESALLMAQIKAALDGEHRLRNLWRSIPDRVTELRKIWRIRKLKQN